MGSTPSVGTNSSKSLEKILPVFTQFHTIWAEMKPKKFPVEIRRGDVTVKIYLVSRGDGYEEFRLSYYDAAGARRQKSFSEFADAKAEAYKVKASFASARS